MQPKKTHRVNAAPAQPRAIAIAAPSQARPAMAVAMLAAVAFWLCAAVVASVVVGS